MKATLLPNQNLIIPKRAESNDGTALGDGMVEITPQDKDYKAWVEYLVQHPGALEPEETAL